MYWLSKEEHEQFFTNAITSTYKKEFIKKKINIAGKQILKNIKILNRVETNGEKNAWRVEESGLFGVTMGAYDQAEMCELVVYFTHYHWNIMKQT